MKGVKKPGRNLQSKAIDFVYGSGNVGLKNGRMPMSTLQAVKSVGVIACSSNPKECPPSY